MTRPYNYSFKAVLEQAKEILKAGPWETEKDFMDSALRLYPGSLSSLTKRDLIRCVAKGNAKLEAMGIEAIKVRPEYDPGVCRDLWTDELTEDSEPEPSDEEGPSPETFFKTDPPLEWSETLQSDEPPEDEGILRYTFNDEVKIAQTGWVTIGGDTPPHEYYSETVHVDEMNQEFPPDGPWLVDEPTEDE